MECSSSKALALRSLNWQLTKAVDYKLFYCDRLSVQIRWGESRAQPPIVKLQALELTDMHKVAEQLDHLLANMRCVRVLHLDLETSDSAPLNAIIERLLDAGKEAGHPGAPRSKT